MFPNENAMVCNQRYSSVLRACFVKMCELPVIYHTSFKKYITFSNIYQHNYLFSMVDINHFKNVFNDNRIEPLCQYLHFVLLWLPDRRYFRITNSNFVICDGCASFYDIKMFIQNNFSNLFYNKI